MKRRSFIGNSIVGGSFIGGLSSVSCSSGTQRRPESSNGYRNEVLINPRGKYDILLKGGTVIDPANNINSIMDVAVADGKIAMIARDIPASDGKRTVDVAGLYVTPGIIDIHAHLLPISLVPDHHCFAAGTTTICDAGTVGADTFDVLKTVIDRSRVRVFSFLNISRKGMGDANNNDPRLFDIDLAVRTAKQYPEDIVGFKSVRYAYWHRKDAGLPLYDDIHTPWASVDAIEEAGQRAGLPCQHHYDPEPEHDGVPARTQREFLLEKAHSGTIYTHCFRRKHPIVMNDGSFNEDCFKAQERGVKFDIGHGANSFCWRNVIAAVKSGFLPDSISTDLHSGCVNDMAINMLNVMSKLLAAGMSLEDVIRCSTLNPARQIQRPELGNLSVGSVADIAVLDLEKGHFSYIDISMEYTDEGSGARVDTDKRLSHIITLFGGRIASDRYGLCYQYWENHPDTDDYWKTHATELELAPKSAYTKYFDKT
ncbi:MAG: amidohydrolase family protein [Candidatus Latescibacteria bacterium]|jgi:dihydroorotase|nr:amidohydrolase family protein [Candidatus Latescibacterota bacterium]